MTLLLLDHPSLGPTDISDRSLYGNAYWQRFNAGLGGTIGNGSGFAGTSAVRARGGISLCNVAIVDIRGRPQQPADG
jgi:hypothetical protein